VPLPASQPPLSRSERPAQPAAKFPVPSGLLRLIVGALAACSARVASEDRLPLTMFTRPTAACLVVRSPNKKQSKSQGVASLVVGYSPSPVRLQLSLPLPSVAAHPLSPFGETQLSQQPFDPSGLLRLSDRWCAVAACGARVASGRPFATYYVHWAHSSLPRGSFA
jgi:hypothetical protein